MEQYAPRLIYIAGKISGLPEEEYQTHFMAAQNLLAQIYPESTIYNPAASLSELSKKMDYDTLMQVCLQIVDLADTFAFLPDFKDSLGAMVELDYALKHGKRILELQTQPKSYRVEERTWQRR